MNNINQTQKNQSVQENQPQYIQENLEINKDTNIEDYEIYINKIENYEEQKNFPFMLVRTGISNYGVDSHKQRLKFTQIQAQRNAKKIGSNTNIELDKNCQDDFDFEMRRLKTSQEYIDSPLNQIGIQQALQNQEFYNQFDVHTVFISPLLRSLQTCYYLFEKHPKRAQIKFKVVPLVSDILRNACSISQDINQKPRNYFQDKQNYDFSEFDNHYQIPSLWQVDQICDSEIKKQLTQEFWHTEEGQDFSQRLIKLMNKVFPKNLESYELCVERAKKFKEYLMNYRKNNDIKQNQKIMIITHKPFIKCLLAENISEEGFVDGPELQNCQAMFFER